MTGVAVAPGPRGMPLLGDVVPLARDPLGFVADLGRTYGRFASFRIGPYRHLLVGDPDAVKHVFVDQHRKYVKGRGYDGVRLALRTGLFVSEGDLWRERRHTMQPMFQRDRLDRYVVAIGDAVRAMHTRWEARVGDWLDVQAEMITLTVDVVGRALLGGPLVDEAPRIGAALTTIIRFANDYGNAVVQMPLWMPFPAHRRFRDALAVIDDVVERLPQSGSDDLASLLAKARSAGTIPAEGVRDELITMLTAGHETTATALTFTFAALAGSPDWSARIRAEADVARALESRGGLPSAAAAFHEALRLWPPIWFLERLAIEDDEVGGFRVPKGDTIAISAWNLQHDPELWPDPERFDPSRFLSGPPAGAQRFAWLPFGAGPRTCIGAQLATMEAQIAIAATLQRFELELGPDGPPEPIAELLLRPEPGFTMRLGRRRGA